MDNLFSVNQEEFRAKKAPLALRMRPETLDEFFGQQELIGKGRILRTMIENDQLNSLIFYGPPGTGKTTLARIIANVTQADFQQVNAVTSGVSDLRQVIKNARDNQMYYGRRTIVFIDEIHRFNKAQQDALLPDVEEGTIILIGSTTENPMFSVNKALLSRSRLFAFQPLTSEAIRNILQRALHDTERGLGSFNVDLPEEVMELLIQYAGGDARVALNSLEMAVLACPPDQQGIRCITKDIAQDVLQQKVVNYEKDGDEHYSVISAFIKSMRGSDPQAAVYWLARMIYAGEDLSFISRRMIIFAAEDIGLADPQALQIALTAAQAADRIGMPEARIILADAVTYLALAEKSNSAYLAVDKALRTIRSGGDYSVPIHLRDGGSGLRDRLGYGRDYIYPHNYPDHWVRQQYLPDELQKQVFYEPQDQGQEKDLVKQWKKRTRQKS